MSYLSLNEHSFSYSIIPHFLPWLGYDFPAYFSATQTSHCDLAGGFRYLLQIAATVLRNSQRWEMLWLDTALSKYRYCYSLPFMPSTIHLIFVFSRLVLLSSEDCFLEPFLKLAGFKAEDYSSMFSLPL